jgi:hypothetical protein
MKSKNLVALSCYIELTKGEGEIGFVTEYRSLQILRI